MNNTARLPTSEELVAAMMQSANASSIGDVNSTAKGSGARYNAGKPPMELLPICLIAEELALSYEGPALDCLTSLGNWQKTGLRVDLSLALAQLGPDIWEEAAYVFDYGRKKYAEWNWAKGMYWSVPTGCAARHLMKIIVKKEDTDDESKLSHRGHAACNLIMLLTYETTYPEGDDRPRYLVDAA